MTDAWRIKSYYRPRVLVPIDSLLSNPYPGRLVYLDGGQVDLIRNLLAYAHRRSTWVAEYRDRDYLAPTEEQWDAIDAALAELEATLMTDCCDDILTRLDTLITQGANVALELEAATAYLDCICTNTGNLAAPARVDINWPPTSDPPTYITWDRSDASQDVSAQAATDACALAQAWYQWGFEFISERLLPALRFGWDALQQALVAAIVVATGGAGIPVAFGIFLTGELLQGLLDIAYDSATNNLYNWIIANKEELVCALYTELQDGGNTATIWQSVYNDVIDGNPELSDGDELIIKLAMGPLAGAVAKKAKEENTTWYQSSVTPGYCAVCSLPPGEFEWYVPPVPGTWYYSGGTDFWNDRLCLHHGCYADQRTDNFLPAASPGYNRIDYTIKFRSSRPLGSLVGKSACLYWDGDSWEPIDLGTSIIANAATGELCTHTETKATLADEPGGRNINVQFLGQPGMYDDMPDPLMIEYVHVKFYRV